MRKAVIMAISFYQKFLSLDTGLFAIKKGTTCVFFPTCSEYTKQAFVFDDDINIFDEREVLWAMSTRTQWDTAITVARNARASGLDPLASDENSTTKVGIDCTKPAPPAPFPTRLYVPEQVRERIKLTDFIAEEKLRRM